MSLIKFILTVFIIQIIGNVSSEGAKNSKLSKHPVFIVISLDGFRYDFMKKYYTPHMHELRGAGVFVPYMRNQFPTATHVNHQSIATGLYPASHGVVHNKIFDPLYNKTFGAGNSELWKFRDDVVPLWITNEAAGDGRISGVLAWPGSQFSIPTHFAKYDTAVPFSDSADTIVSWITNRTHPANLVYAYFDEPDTQAHQWGPNSEQTKQGVEKVDTFIGYFVQKLKSEGIYDGVNIIILSDHGFAEVTLKTVIDLSKMSDTSKYDVSGQTPVLHIFPKQGELDNVFNTLTQASVGNHFRVLKTEGLGDSRWHYSGNRRIPPIIVVGEEGYAFQDLIPSYIDYYNKLEGKIADENRIYGVHGYDNRLSSMLPLFMAHGPLFKKGGMRLQPFHNIDLYPLICKGLNITPQPNNGTLDNTKQLLV